MRVFFASEVSSNKFLALKKSKAFIIARSFLEELFAASLIFCLLGILPSFL